MPASPETEVGSTGEAIQDRYVIPEPEEIVPTYVRHEAPWVGFGPFIVTASWFLPVLTSPTSQLGRIGSFAALSVGGVASLGILWRTWHWAHRGE